MNAMSPIPQIIPENAPFSPEQRAWLNGFLAAYLGVDGGHVGAVRRWRPRPRRTKTSPGMTLPCRWPSAWSSPRTASHSVS